MIRIEPEDPVKENQCATCGGTARLLHGYVLDDPRAPAVEAWLKREGAR